MAYPNYGPQATPQAAPPQPQMPAYDMGGFDSGIAELQAILQDLDGDGVPDAAQGAPAGPPARIPVDARSQQDYSDQYGAEPPRARPQMQGGPQQPMADSGLDVRQLGEEAKARIQAGEPRESVIQDLFLRVTRNRAQMADAGGAPQGDPMGEDTMTDAMMAPPMPPMPRGRNKFGALPVPPDGGNDETVMTRRPDEMPRSATLEAPRQGRRSQDYGGVLNQMVDEGELEEPEGYGAPEVPPEEEEAGPSVPWNQGGLIGIAKRGAQAVGNAAEGAYDYMTDWDWPSGDEMREAAGQGLEAAGNLAIAAEATGGPQGAITGAIGRGLTSAGRLTAGNRLREGVRSLTAEGREVNDVQNRLMAAHRTSRELSRRSGKPPMLPQRVIDENVLYGQPSRWDIASGKIDDVEQGVGEAAAQWLTRDYPTALPAPKPGQPNRLIPAENQPIPPPSAYERAGGAAWADRDAARARDILRGTAREGRQQALDDSLDGFMQTLSGVPKEHASSIPSLIKSHAEETGTSLPEVVSALERRGYRIDPDSVPQHAFQSRSPDGRWSKLDPDWAELLSIIRERAGRPPVGRR
jgi:hypothetical protein